ncbi:MAG: transposase, partial [Burkholderiales bacterium]
VKLSCKPVEPLDHRPMKIVINGAGIAGPTLAYWLRKCVHTVLLVEQAPRLRTGGYVIDFWGVGYDIAEKMGLLPQIRDLAYTVREVRFVDRHVRSRGGFQAAVLHRLTSGRVTSLRHNKGLDRFTLRGQAKVDGQWKLYCQVHNIEKLARKWER